MQPEQPQTRSQRTCLQGPSFYLNAGVYRVESRYGDANAIARADIEVQPGKLVRAKINHRAAQAMFRLVDAASGEAAPGVTWQMLASNGSVVARSDQSAPSMILAEGAYEAVATLGQTSYRSAFEIRPGEQTTVEIPMR